MRIAFVSDIHANLQAWQAVYADIAAQGADRIICLGDIVGYGPNPAETLAAVYSRVHYFVLGNHDAVIAGLKDASGFNAQARQMIEWARKRLGKKAVAFFRRVPLSIRHAKFRCAHGSPLRPSAFAYILDESDARACWNAVNADIIFVGHTHQPAAHVLRPNGQYASLTAAEGKLRLEDGHRYILNAGSVGLSRDRDFRAAYAIFDANAGIVQWRRVAFDVEQFMAAVRRAYDGVLPTDMLIAGLRRAQIAPLRETLDFTPGDEIISQSVRAEEDIGDLRAAAARWRHLSLAAAILLVFLVAAFLWYWRTAPRPVLLDGGPAGKITLADRSAGMEIDFLAGSPQPVNQPPPGWRYALADTKTQEVRKGSNNLTLVSRGNAGTMEITLPAIALGDCRRPRLLFAVANPANLQGDLPWVEIDYCFADGKTKLNAETKSIPASKLETAYTLKPPASVAAVQIRVVGKFDGEVVVERLRLQTQR